VVLIGNAICSMFSAKTIKKPPRDASIYDARMNRLHMWFAEAAPVFRGKRKDVAECRRITFTSDGMRRPVQSP
jgi:hypothetical protein